MRASVAILDLLYRVSRGIRSGQSISSTDPRHPVQKIKEGKRSARAMHRLRVFRRMPSFLIFTWRSTFIKQTHQNLPKTKRPEGKSQSRNFSRTQIPADTPPTSDTCLKVFLFYSSLDISKNPDPKWNTSPRRVIHNGTHHREGKTFRHFQKRRS